MSSQSTSELLSSLKELLTTGAYSDLKITCGDDEYKVHKAIVCPRSYLLSVLCREVEDHIDAVLAMPNDDPQAIELMLHYLYTLDYPKVPMKSLENGTNGASAEDTKSPDGHTPPAAKLVYSIEKEEFEVIPPDENVEPVHPRTDPVVNFPKKKSKKSKKKITTISCPSVSDDTSEHATATAVTSNLVIHAKVYAVGCKYGIEGLQILSGEKFVTEVEHHWDSDDFLGAAREAYTSTEGGYRTIRDAVLNAIKLHPELLGKKQVQDVIKGLELSFELLMHFHDAAPQATN